MNKPITHTFPLTEIIDIAQKEGVMLKDEIIRRHIDAGEYATGRTSKMLRVQNTGNGFQLRGWKYTDTYEVGRGPGQRPPMDAILTWMEAKGLTLDKDEGQVVYFAKCICDKIEREGTLRYRNPQSRPDIFTTPIKEMRERLKKEESNLLKHSIAGILLTPDPNRQ